MLNFLNTQQSHADYSTSTMEADTISKNGRNPKSQTSRGDESIKNYELKITRFFCCCFVCLFFTGAFSAYAQGAKLKIAVLDITGSGSMTSILTTELVNTKKYIVMERSKVQQIINELGLQSEQNASARAAEIGNLLGVDKIITGEGILVESGTYAYGISLHDYKVSLRLIDVESGAIESAVTMGQEKYRTYYKKSCYNCKWREISKLEYEKRERAGKYRDVKEKSDSEEVFAKKLLNALLN